MKRHVLIPLLAIALSLSIASLASARWYSQQGHMGMHGGMRSDWWNDADIQKELSLNTDQVNKLQAAWDKFDQNRKAVWTDLLKGDKELEAAFGEEKIDNQKITSLAKNLKDLQDRLLDNRVDYRLSVNQILTSAQRQKLGSTLSSRGIKHCPACPTGIMGAPE